MDKTVKCDTAENKGKAIVEDQMLWCRRCWRDYNESAGEAETRSCFGCGLVHLASRTTEKLEGWRCLNCAKKYEQELLAKLTA